MALTVTSRGTGNHNTGATTLVPGGRTATLAAGSMGVFCISVDNQGSGGASTLCPSSWTDAKGNVWTRRQNALYDNGAASAGIEMGFYTAPITVALLTTDAGTITWDGGVSPVAKAWTWYEVIPSGGNTVAYSTGGTIAGATAANAQVTTASVLVGDAVIAGYFSENTAAVTQDSDSTNGSWTAQQTDTIGSGTSGVRIATQQKVQTTTASTQSYDATVASQDRIAGYIMLHEVVNTTVTPGVVALTTSLFAPTVSAPNNQLATPTTLAVTSATFAPTVSATAHQTVTPTTLAVATTAFAPTVATPTVVTPPTLSLATAAFAPTVSTTAHVTATPGVTALTTTPFAPTVATPTTVTPGVVALATTALAPTVTASAHQTVTPDVVAVAVATFAPTVTGGEGLTIVPTTLSVAMTSFAPTVVLTDHRTVTPAPVSLAMTAFAPSTVATDNLIATPTAGSLVLALFAPPVIADIREGLPAEMRLRNVAPSFRITSTRQAPYISSGRSIP